MEWIYVSKEELLKVKLYVKITKTLAHAFQLNY